MSLTLTVLLFDSRLIEALFAASFCQLIRTNKRWSPAAMIRWGQTVAGALFGNQLYNPGTLVGQQLPQFCFLSAQVTAGCSIYVSNFQCRLYYLYKCTPPPPNLMLCASINLRLSQHFPQDYPRLQWVAFWPHGGSTGRLQRNMRICYLRSRLRGCEILSKFATEPWFHARQLVLIGAKRTWFSSSRVPVLIGIDWSEKIKSTLECPQPTYKVPWTSGKYRRPKRATLEPIVDHSSSCTSI